MRDRETIEAFLRTYHAEAVGAAGPPLPILPPAPDEADDAPTNVTLDCEVPAEKWKSLIVPEAPARPGEFPVRFIDGSQSGEPVLWLRSPAGWPLPLVLAEVGAVALRLEGRHFRREFARVERVLSFVADPFPWEEVEAFSAALANDPGLRLRVVPANLPSVAHNPFDYEIMKSQAIARARQEMNNWERLALARDTSVPTLVDGPLHRVMGDPDPGRPLLVGVAKIQWAGYLHEQGWRTLFDLRPGQRTPVFKITGGGEGEREGRFPVATWYLKLAGGPRLAPNWGYVRAEVPWAQFEQQFASDFGFVHRLSRWLMDARCRQESYQRMPVSLEPIVRAEECLKPLFTPLSVLTHRLYRQAGLPRSTS